MQRRRVAETGGEGAGPRAQNAPEAVHGVQPGEHRAPTIRWTATPWAFIATSATLLRAANANRLAASKARRGARAGPNSTPENTTSETSRARRIPVRGTTRPPSWRPRTRSEEHTSELQ